jgi:hypothetical protein
MPQLKFFRLLTERLQSKDYSPILSLKKLQHLSLSANKEVLKRYDQLLELPELKWGTIKTRPELYRK